MTSAADLAGFTDPARLREGLDLARREGRALIQEVHDRQHEGEPAVVCGMVRRLDDVFAFLSALDDEDLAREFRAWTAGPGLRHWLMDMNAALHTEGLERPWLT